MNFLIFIALVAVAYFAWRIVDQLPDVLYRLSEIQRDVAELRRHLTDDGTTPADNAAGDDAETSS